MTNIAARLAKLEKANPAAAPPRVIRLVCSSKGELLEAAIDRWCKEYPDEPRPADEDVILLWGVSPPERGAQ
jgi:hypothetical protein